MKLPTIGLLLAINVGLGFGKVLPLLKKVICPRNTTNMSSCYIKAIETLRPQLISGQYGGGIEGPPLDPYELDLNIDNGNDFKATLKDVTITGVRDFEISAMNVAMSKNRASATIKFPSLEIVGKYKLKMNLGSLLQVNGEGPFNTTDNPTMKLTVTYETDRDNLVTFLPTKVGLTFNNPVLYLGGLFPKNPAMEALANGILNSNPDALLNQLKPELEEHLAETITRIANIFVEGSTLDELFPDE